MNFLGNKTPQICIAHAGKQFYAYQETYTVKGKCRRDIEHLKDVVIQTRPPLNQQHT